MKQPILSGAMELLTVVWRQSQRTRQHSWRSLNGSMHEALRLAVSSGMEFGADDFLYMSEHFRMGYWCGDLEYFYKDAVLVRNASLVCNCACGRIPLVTRLHFNVIAHPSRFALHASRFTLSAYFRLALSTLREPRPI